jgi:hypothetical protein
LVSGAPDKTTETPLILFCFFEGAPSLYAVPGVGFRHGDRRRRKEAAKATGFALATRGVAIHGRIAIAVLVLRITMGVVGLAERD